MYGHTPRSVHWFGYPTMCHFMPWYLQYTIMTWFAQINTWACILLWNWSIPYLQVVQPHLARLLLGQTNLIAKWDVYLHYCWWIFQSPSNDCKVKSPNLVKFPPVCWHHPFLPLKRCGKNTTFWKIMKAQPIFPEIFPVSRVPTGGPWRPWREVRTNRASRSPYMSSFSHAPVALTTLPRWPVLFSILGMGNPMVNFSC